MKYSENPVKNKKILWVTIGISVATLGLIHLSRTINKSVDVEDSNESDAKTPDVEQQPIVQQLQPDIVIEEPKQLLSIKGEFDSRLKNKPGLQMLLIGDSQALRTMGKAFQEAIPESRNNIDYWGIEGTTPNKIIKNHILKSTNEANLLIAKLSQKPSIIVVQLGDNGINNSDECDRLIRYIHSFYTEKDIPLVIWSGPFPLCIPEGTTGNRYVLPACKDDPRCINNYQAKKKDNWTTKIKNATKVFPNVYFNSPYDSVPFNIPNIRCFTSDGVHITKNAMNQYVDFLINKELTNE